MWIVGVLYYIISRLTKQKKMTIKNYSSKTLKINIHFMTDTDTTILGKEFFLDETTFSNQKIISSHSSFQVLEEIEIA